MCLRVNNCIHGRVSIHFTDLPFNMKLKYAITKLYISIIINDSCFVILDTKNAQAVKLSVFSRLCKIT